MGILLLKILEGRDLFLIIESTPNLILESPNEESNLNLLLSRRSPLVTRDVLIQYLEIFSTKLLILGWRSASPPRKLLLVSHNY